MYAVACSAETFLSLTFGALDVKDDIQQVVVVCPFLEHGAQLATLQTGNDFFT